MSLTYYGGDQKPRREMWLVCWCQGTMWAGARPHKGDMQCDGFYVCFSTDVLVDV